ncbi:hypothetical protein HRbin22_00199 [Candidatus Thermoflexus japonica]|uniref:DUF2231 domain-containing protein n=1 Tax=Candidatus Thermoflexus japonica TaxID=2035417 RepID=A0A2H5Y3G1_9CHLR|nr:hypothetical protein HRbin22_00199 [Candidatus Thermoflexus japonica]
MKGSQWSIGGGWTLREVLQGKPIGHPTHALVIHFPAGLWPAALLFDLLSWIRPDPTLVRAAFYDILLGLGMAGVAILTGLLDFLPTVPGSRKRRLGWQHLLAQVGATTSFAVSAGLRALDPGSARTPILPLALAFLGVGLLLLGNFLGGELVYRHGMRVGASR